MTLVPPTSIPQECEKLFWGLVGFREIYVFGFSFSRFWGFSSGEDSPEGESKTLRSRKKLVCIAQFFVSRFTAFSGFP